MMDSGNGVREVMGDHMLRYYNDVYKVNKKIKTLT